MTDISKRNLDWIKTLHWSMSEDGIPFESMEQVNGWMADRFPGISDEEILVKFIQMPAFEAAPLRLQSEAYDDLAKELKRNLNA